MVKIRNTFFNNPYFAEDLTRINTKVAPQFSLPPEAWGTMNPDKKAEKLSKDISYVFLELFIYEENKIFPEYEISRKGTANITTNFYMIDFRHIFMVRCEKIISSAQSPLDAKCLQLSIETRAKLRDKISLYFARVPIEDAA